MLKAELSTTGLHQVYPLLFERLRRAEGAVAGLMGLQYAPTFEEYDVADFERHLKNLKLPGGERTRLMRELEQDRPTGIKELNMTARRVDLQRARGRLFRTRNYLVLKSLYLSDPVKSAALEAWDTLWGVWVDLDVGSEAKDPSFFKTARVNLEAAATRLLALEGMMRSELQPSRREHSEDEAARSRSSPGTRETSPGP
jgi:hypothetical protein